MINPGTPSRTDLQLGTTRASRTSAFREPYPVHDFLDDQRRLLSLVQPGRRRPTRRIESLDGHMVVVHLVPLFEAMQTEMPAAEVFRRKYGAALAASRLSRFRAVVDFLKDRRAEVSHAGMARDREPMEVREELVRHLLGWELGPGQARIPSGALDRFLDEWGLRWM